MKLTYVLLRVAIATTSSMTSAQPSFKSDRSPILSTRGNQPPLADEKDGVLSKGGAVIDSPAWSAPSGSPVPDNSHGYDFSGPYSAYIVQNGFGDPVQYQAWFPDA